MHVRAIATTALALCMLGCGSSATRGEQVPLPIDATATAFGKGCILMHVVVDVVADPETGTPILENGDGPFRWPKGFTAWRSGTEVEVLDGDGRVVLRTGARYSICPSAYLTGWVIGMVTPCPDCKLGFQVD